MNNRKKTVILVGALALRNPDIIGGVRYACESLLNSPLSQQVDWLPIDSAVSQKSGIVRRGVLALWRVVQLLYLLLRYRRVESVLIFGNYDLTSFAEKGLLVLLGRAFRKRTILSIRSEIRPYRYDRWFRKFRRFALGACTHILCQSELAARRLVEMTGCDGRKITVLMNWIDYAQYAPPHRPAESGKPVRFIFVGHLTANKAPDVLVKAAHRLKREGIPFHIDICGEGPLHDQLRADIEAFDLAAEVDLRGWITGPALKQMLWDAQVFVLPTHSEGMPNALLEAMAAGLPVISTPVSSIPEMVTEGVNGSLVPPGDSEALADAMRRMIVAADRLRTIGAVNREQIREKHSVDHAWRVVAGLL